MDYALSCLLNDLTVLWLSSRSEDLTMLLEAIPEGKTVSTLYSHIVSVDDARYCAFTELRHCSTVVQRTHRANTHTNILTNCEMQ